MRTTLAIDDGCYARLRSEMRRRGWSFRAVVNESLRLGLDAMTNVERRVPFKVEPVPGSPAPGVELDNIAGLLEQMDEPSWPPR